jgi:hypothetical protein
MSHIPVRSNMTKPRQLAVETGPWPNTKQRYEGQAQTAAGFFPSDGQLSLETRDGRKARTRAAQLSLEQRKLCPLEIGTRCIAAARQAGTRSTHVTYAPAGRRRDAGF